MSESEIENDANVIIKRLPSDPRAHWKILRSRLDGLESSIVLRIRQTIESVSGTIVESEALRDLLERLLDGSDLDEWFIRYQDYGNRSGKNELP